MNGHVNGTIAERPSDIQSEMTMKRKRVPVEADAGRNSARRDDSGSNNEDDEEIIISEEHYRNMLSEHFQKYKRARMLEFVSARPTVQANRKRDRAKYKALDADKVDTNGIEGSNMHPAGAVKQYARKSRGKKVEADSGPLLLGPPEPTKVSVMEHMSGPGTSGPGMLDLNVEAPYEVPPPFDQLAPSFEYTPLEISDGTMKGSGNATSIVPMMVADPRAELWQLRAGMRGAYDEGQPGVNVLRMFEEDMERKLRPPEAIERNMLSGFLAEGSNGQGSGGSDGPGGEVLDEPGIEVLEGSQPGATMRHISSDGGLMKHCEVKVIERGEGYEVSKLSTLFLLKLCQLEALACVQACQPILFNLITLSSSFDEVKVIHLLPTSRQYFAQLLQDAKAFEDFQGCWQYHLPCFSPTSFSRILTCA